MSENIKNYQALAEYIQQNYYEEEVFFEKVRYKESMVSYSRLEVAEELSSSIEDQLQNVNDTFSDYLLKVIDKRKMIDADVYKRANLDRKHFSKIRSNKYYQPKKETVLALGLALRLNVDEMLDLLQTAGFTLSNSSKVDIIVRWHLEQGIFNIHQINEALYEFDQRPIGY